MNGGAGGLAPVLATVGVLTWVVFRGHRPFSLARAMQRVGGPSGEAVGRLLSMLTIVTTIATTDVVPPRYIHAWGVSAILFVAAGSAIAPRVTDRLLSAMGVVLVFWWVVVSSGPQTALLLLVVAMLGVWVTGLIRGFRS